jgi:hypothetical protein
MYLDSYAERAGCIRWMSSVYDWYVPVRTGTFIPVRTDTSEILTPWIRMGISSYPSLRPGYDGIGIWKYKTVYTTY